MFERKKRSWEKLTISSIHVTSTARKQAYPMTSNLHSQSWRHTRIGLVRSSRTSCFNVFSLFNFLKMIAFFNFSIELFKFSFFF